MPKDEASHSPVRLPASPPRANAAGSAVRCSGGFLLVVVDFRELGVNHVVLLIARAAGIAAVTALLLGAVHGLAELHRGGCERLGLRLDIVGVRSLERFLEIGERILDRRAVG